MISDKCAEDIARRLLAPFIKFGFVTDAALASSIEIVKLRVEQDDCEKTVQQAEAAIQMHGFLADTFKRLPR